MSDGPDQQRGRAKHRAAVPPKARRGRRPATPSRNRLERQVTLVRLRDPEQGLDAPVRCDPSTLADLHHTWLAGVVDGGSGHPVVFLAEPNSPLLRSLNDLGIRNDAERFAKVQRWIERVRPSASPVDAANEEARIRWTRSLVHAIPVDREPGAPTLSPPSHIRCDPNWTQLEVHLLSQGRELIGIYFPGPTLSDACVAIEDLRRVAELVLAPSAPQGSASKATHLHAAAKTADRSSKTLEDIPVQGWSIQASVNAAKTALQQRLPGGREPDPNWSLSSSAFSIHQPLDGGGVFHQLEEHGWSAETFLRSGHRGREWAFLTLAAHELEQEDPDLATVAAALTAFRDAIARLGRSSAPTDLRRTYALINEAVYQQKSASNAASAIGFPRPDSRRFDRLRTLTASAPWIALLPRDAHAGLRSAVTVEQLAELAAMGGTALVLPSLEVRVRPGSSLCDRFIVSHDSVPVEPPVIATIIDAAAAALTAPGESHRLLAQVPPPIRTRLLRVESLWPSTNPEESAAHLRTWVDVRHRRSFTMNLSRRHVEVAIGDGPSLVLHPFDPDIEEYTLFAGHLRDIEETDRIVTGDIRSPLILGALETPRLFTESAADSTNTRLFLGRERELAQLRRWLLTPVPEARKPAVIHGNRRAGKTTLAKHVLTTAVRDGELCASVVLDVIDGAGAAGTRGDAYPPRLARSLHARIGRQLRTLGLSEALPDGEPTDPIELLVEIDDRWPLGAPPLGLLLDELDSLFHHRENSVLYALATRFGNLQLRNIALVGTVQRHGHEANVLKEWGAVQCTASLSWQHALRYFCGVDEIETSGPICAADRPLITPWQLAKLVIPRTGYRPYFWAHLYSRLENCSILDEIAIIPDEDIRAAIDEIVRNDTFLALFSQRADGLSPTEARRQDVFTEAEVALLAEFALSATDYVTDARIRKVFGWDTSALAGLVERELLTRRGDWWILTAGVFDEYLKAHRLEFGPWKRSTPSPDTADQATDGNDGRGLTA